ncbi:MAG: hypothetical protein LIO49_05520 [Ruminococcus sp.]|nr:hypothetical protein [Ruminococcus sp.]
MADTNFSEWLHRQKNIDFLLLGVPNPDFPGKCLYVTDIEIKGDNETVTLPLPHTKEEYDKSFVNVIYAFSVLNRSARDKGSDTVWECAPEDDDSSIRQAFKEYVEIFYGDSEAKGGETI